MSTPLLNTLFPADLLSERDVETVCGLQQSTLLWLRRMIDRVNNGRSMPRTRLGPRLAVDQEHLLYDLVLHVTRTFRDKLRNAFVAAYIIEETAANASQFVLRFMVTVIWKSASKSLHPKLKKEATKAVPTDLLADGACTGYLRLSPITPMTILCAEVYEKCLKALPLVFGGSARTRSYWKSDATRDGASKGRAFEQDIFKETLELVGLGLC